VRVYDNVDGMALYLYGCVCICLLDGNLYHYSQPASHQHVSQRGNQRGNRPTSQSLRVTMITIIVVTEAITRTAIGFETITNATNMITENTSERLIANEVAIIAITIITVPVTIIIGRVTAGPMITTTDHKTMMMNIIIVMTMIMVYGERRFEQQQNELRHSTMVRIPLPTLMLMPMDTSVTTTVKKRQMRRMKPLN